MGTRINVLDPLLRPHQPAFPFSPGPTSDTVPGEVTLRCYLVGMTIQGILARQSTRPVLTPEESAQEARLAADAVIRDLNLNPFQVIP